MRWITELGKGAKPSIDPLTRTAAVAIVVAPGRGRILPLGGLINYTIEKNSTSGNILSTILMPRISIPVISLPTESSGYAEAAITGTPEL